MEVKLNNLSMDFEYAVPTPSSRTQKAEPAKEETQQREQLKDDNDIQSLMAATEEMTQWMQKLNTDIQFALHEGTERLMVQVVDIKEHKVLKEFPPSEFLDTIAKIQEYVGILLDKKV